MRVVNHWNDTWNDSKKINQLTEPYRNMSDVELHKEADKWCADIDLKNKRQVNHVIALAREVTYRKLGKFQYDVQVLGALAALERKYYSNVYG